MPRFEENKSVPHDSEETSSAAPLKEGIDYTFEKGLLVFTAHYLLERGFCCGSGCRHCPYDVGQ